MDTFGENLRSSRENKGYSLEQVARDTNIAKKFLIALEEEDFSIFPGEPYLIGFLKNYADYLGLDSSKIVALHRNMKLQEQPVPIEELLNTGKSRVSIVVISILVVVLAGVGGYFLFNYLSNQESEPVIEEVEELQVPENFYAFDLNTSDIEYRFPEGSELEILLFEEVYSVYIKEVSSSVILSLPDGELMLNLGAEKTSDFNGDGTPDVFIGLNDIDINKKTADIILTALDITVQEAEISELPEPGVSNIASRNKDITIIKDAQGPEPFIIDVVFRGNTLLRYLFDRGERVERYFDKGETLRLDVNREIMIWVANAGSFKAKISGIDVSLGRSGEVSTQMIKWNKNSDSGKYELQMIPMY